MNIFNSSAIQQFTWALYHWKSLPSMNQIQRTVFRITEFSHSNLKINIISPYTDIPNPPYAEIWVKIVDPPKQKT